MTKIILHSFFWDTVQKSLRECTLPAAAILDSVKSRDISRLNYLCRIDKFSEDILRQPSYCWRFQCGGFDLELRPCTLTLTYQQLTNDIRRTCGSFHEHRTFTFWEMANEHKKRTNQWAKKLTNTPITLMFNTSWWR